MLKLYEVVENPIKVTFKEVEEIKAEIKGELKEVASDIGTDIFSELSYALGRWFW